jgi:hypothetical protein
MWRDTPPSTGDCHATLSDDAVVDENDHDHGVPIAEMPAAGGGSAEEQSADVTISDDDRVEVPPYAPTLDG